VTFTAPQNDATYAFRLKARDEKGNESAWQTLTGEVSQYPIAINEVAWMGTTASFQDEWIELSNKTGQAISLEGWTLSIESSGQPTRNIVLSGSIAPYGQYLMERTNDSAVSDIPADLIFTGGIENNYTYLVLRTDQWVWADSTPQTGFDWAAGDNATKRTMERVRLDIAGHDRYNWLTHNGRSVNGHDAAGNAIQGTPRARNSVFKAYTLVTTATMTANTDWKASRSPYYIPSTAASAEKTS